MRKVKLSVIAMSLVFALAGCGNVSSEKGTESLPSETTSDNEKNTDGQEAGDAKEITFWYYHAESTTAELEKIIEEYNSMQNDIHITGTWVAREDLMKQYTIGAVSGELPDICMVDSPNMAAYIELGIFQDITDKITGWDGFEHLYSGPLSSCTGSDGKIYGIPNNTNCLALVCNMDLLKEHGYEETPKTWDEFYEIAKACADSNTYGFTMSAISSEEGTFQMLPWLYAAGGSVEDIDSLNVETGINFLKDMVDNGIMSPEVTSLTQADAYKNFCAGQAAMLESGTWQLASIDADTDFSYEYALLPKKVTNASVIGGENYGISSSCKYPDEVWAFLEWFGSAENNGKWADVTGRIPVRDDAAEYVTSWADDPNYAVFTESMNYAVARGPHSEWTAISEAIRTAVQNVLLGTKDTKAALADANAVIEPILKENPLPKQK